MAVHGTHIGDLLRQWRGATGLSQLDLGLAADVSARHLSFVENGRARPSRSLILRLGEALGMPLRECNLLLLAAGFGGLLEICSNPSMPFVRERARLSTNSVVLVINTEGDTSSAGR